jgi:hypothetical protein
MSITVVQETMDTSTLDDLEITTSSGQVIDTGSQALEPDGGVEQPVVWDSGSMLFRPWLMEIDTPYGFKYLDHWMWAVRRRDGSIDVFYLPTDENDVPVGSEENKVELELEPR